MYQGIGHPVCSGVAIGRAYVYCREQGELSGKCGEITEEQKKFEAARTVAREQLTELYEKNPAGTWRRAGYDSRCSDYDAG